MGNGLKFLALGFVLLFAVFGLYVKDRRTSLGVDAGETNGVPPSFITLQFKGAGALPKSYPHPDPPKPHPEL